MALCSLARRDGVELTAAVGLTEPVAVTSNSAPAGLLLLGLSAFHRGTRRGGVGSQGIYTGSNPVGAAM